MKSFNILEKNEENINFCNHKGDNLLNYLFEKELLNGYIFKILFNKAINVGIFLKMLYQRSEEQNEINDNNDSNEIEHNLVDHQENNEDHVNNNNSWVSTISSKL